MSGSSAERRPARMMVVCLVVLATAVVCAGGGWWLGHRSAGHVTTAPAAGAEEQLYSCGMHPQVIQKGPGDCPICGMKLTPLKAGQQKEAAAGAGGPQERRILYWRAPMDPNYVSDLPGKSPMGMDLVPVYAPEGESLSAGAVVIDPVTIQNMGIRTARVKRGPLVKTIRTVGRVDYNEQAVSYINMKFNGWIEKLYVDETGQRVDQGQRLFDVYSPELYSAQEEYLAALRGLQSLAQSSQYVKDDARRLLETARLKLRYLDVSDEQVDELGRTKQIRKTLTIHSPAQGIVTEKMALEGMYVTPGMKLYTIADLSRVWVYVDIYEYQLPWVSIGQEARMALAYIPTGQFTGKVTYIYPYLQSETRVIKVRLEFENPGFDLKPGMYATIMLNADLRREALLVPRSAYIDTGIRKVAFIALDEGKFKPREIRTGVETDDGRVEVVYGLDEGELVVTSGQFLIDAESKLQEAIAKMTEPQKSVPESEGEAGGERPTDGEAPPAPSDAAAAETHHH